MFNEVYETARRAGYTGLVLPHIEDMSYAFTSRDQPQAETENAQKVRWFSVNEGKFTIHTAIYPSGSAATTLREELLWRDSAENEFVETLLSAATKIKRLKLSNLSPSTFAARFYGLDGTAAQKFAELTLLKSAPATVTVVPHGDIEETYRQLNNWSVSCMTTRHHRTEIYDSSTDCAMLIVKRGDENMGRVLVYRPKEQESWKLSKDNPLIDDNPDLTGWYYTRIYGRINSCGCYDSEGEGYTRRAIEALGCRQASTATSGVVCLSSENGYAPWFDYNQGGNLWWDGDKGKRCVVVFGEDRLPDWISGGFQLFENNLEYDYFGEDENNVTCNCCGESFHEEDVSYVEEAGGDLCNYCLNEHYTWIDEEDRYVHNEDVATHARTGECVCAESYISVQRPHRNGGWVCDEEDTVEIDGDYYYRPDIDNGHVGVVDWCLELVPAASELRYDLKVVRRRTVAQFTLEMRHNDELHAVSIAYNVNRLVSGRNMHLRAPVCNFGDENYVTLHDDAGNSFMITGFMSTRPMLVDSNWIVVTDEGSAYGTWHVGDDLKRYTIERTHTRQSISVGGVNYTILGDRQDRLHVSWSSNSYGPQITRVDGLPAPFRYIPINEVCVYSDTGGQFVVNGRPMNTVAEFGPFEVLGFTSYYGGMEAIAVLFDGKIVAINSMGLNIDEVVTRLRNVDTQTAFAEYYAANRDVVVLERIIRNILN